jgi:hypothetical protein
MNDCCRLAVQKTIAQIEKTIDDAKFKNANERLALSTLAFNQLIEELKSEISKEATTK